MDIVLLGSTGFVGQALVKALVQAEWVRSVRVLCRGAFPEVWLNDPKIKIIRGGLPDFPADLFPVHDPFVIIHFASLQRTADPTELRVNWVGIDALFKRSGRNLRGFVYGSSLSVHGQGAQSGVHADSPLLPETPLAVSRVECEVLIQNQCEEREIGFALLRSRFILAVNDPSTLMPWIKLAKAGIMIGDGKQKFSIIERKDYAQVIVSLAESYKKSHGYAVGAFPVGYENPLEFGRIWQSIRSLHGLTPKSRLAVPANALLLKALHASRFLDSTAVKLELMGFDHYADVDALKPFVSQDLLKKDAFEVTLGLVKASLA